MRSNAPIEIRKKDDEIKDETMLSPSISDKNKESQDVLKQRDRMKQIAQKIFHQLKSGCKKDLCLNQYCRTNAFARDELDKLKNDKEIFMHAMKLLQANKSDPDTIICSESKTINASNLDDFTNDQLMDVFEDFYQFSCSFVDKEARDSSKSPIMQCAMDFKTA